MRAENNNGAFVFNAACASILAALLVALKLTGRVAWSWVWGLAPVWISTGIALLIRLVASAIIARKSD